MIHELENKGIKSPTGRDRWRKRTVELILTNEKYTGDVLLGKTYCKDYPNNERRINNGESDLNVYNLINIGVKLFFDYHLYK